MQSDGPDFDGLVAQVLSGNREAFRGIVDGCESKVRLALAAMLQESSNVDDLTQETFVTAFRKLSQYQPGTNFPAWVKAIARNLALNERRAWQRRQAATKKYEGLLQVEERLDDAVDALGASLPDEVLGSLHTCIEALAPHTRDMVKARYLEDVPIETIAKQASREYGSDHARHSPASGRHDCNRGAGCLEG